MFHDELIYEQLGRGDMGVLYEPSSEMIWVFHDAPNNDIGFMEKRTIRVIWVFHDEPSNDGDMGVHDGPSNEVGDMGVHDDPSNEGDMGGDMGVHDEPNNEVIWVFIMNPTMRVIWVHDEPSNEVIWGDMGGDMGVHDEANNKQLGRGNMGVLDEHCYENPTIRVIWVFHDEPSNEISVTDRLTDGAQTRTNYKCNFSLLTRIDSLPPCGHVFQQTRTIFKLIHDIIKTNVLTINVASRVLTSFYYSPLGKIPPPPVGYVFQPTETTLKLIQDIIGTNLRTKFHKEY
ncbi:hypothetical protein DPMN_011504 [Dreissena polymorpha]|uniref:Uncharacterized protein n=1 Tax=Dreissena polymorpha TaxID=45954 RepID=A0A9D4N690_DREPO|nr:hypothetical protein DPMN_011504 [Dreissena polymorpha]